MPAPQVAIIVINWNKLDVTRECLASLQQLAYPNLRTYVVDNGSEEKGTAEAVAGRAGTQLIENPVNLGYAGGNNAAMARAFADGADYAWLLNNDCVPEPDTLQALVATAEATPNIGLVSPLLYRNPGSDALEVAGVRLDVPHYGLDVTMSLDEAGRWQREAPSRVALYGTALLVSRRLFSEIGGFDEKFFAYYEDIDLSIRSLGAGFANILDFGARVYHRERPRGEGHQVAAHLLYYMARNRILLWAKHGGQRARLRVLVWELRRRMEEIAAAKLHKQHRGHAEAILTGLWDGWSGRGGPYLPERRAPLPLRQLLLANPRLWVRTIDLLLKSSTRPA